MKIFRSLILSLSSFALVAPVLATETDPHGDGVNTDCVINGENPAQICGIASILDGVMDIVFPVAGVVCLVFIIIGGYMWIASAGDPAKVKQAQGTLTWAIIGLVFVLIVRLIVSAVLGAL